MKTRTTLPYYSYWTRSSKAFIAAEGDPYSFGGGGGVGASLCLLDYFQCLYALAINDTMKKVHVDYMTKLCFQTKCQERFPTKTEKSNIHSFFYVILPNAIKCLHVQYD